MTPLGVIVLVVLVDLLGFTLVMPLLGPFGEQYGFKDWQIGFLFSAYPVCQLVAGPILGRLSDRYGRKPLLIFSQAGTALSFLILGLSRDFTVMLLARMLDGASGGNILVAQAYVADVTEPEHRARGMGLIGMAFGLGFVLGPLLGGLLLGLPMQGPWRLRLPFLVAAAFSTLAWVLVLFRLPESRPAAEPPARGGSHAESAGHRRYGRRSRRRPLGRDRVPRRARLRGVRGHFRAVSRSPHALGRSNSGIRLRGAGVLERDRAGGIDSPPRPAFRRATVDRDRVDPGRWRLCLPGAASRTSAGLIGALAVLGLGQGMLTPSVSGLLSRITPIDEQGAVFGTLTSAQTLARMISYLMANFLLGRVSTAAPYWGSFGIDLSPLAIAGCGSRRLRSDRVIRSVNDWIGEVAIEIAADRGRGSV